MRDFHFYVHTTELLVSLLVYLVFGACKLKKSLERTLRAQNGSKTC